MTLPHPSHPHLTHPHLTYPNPSNPSPPDRPPNQSLPDLSHARSPDLSLDTHIDELLSVFEKVNKSLFMFIKCKQTWKSKNKQHKLTP
jgi:hypothetical protein